MAEKRQGMSVITSDGRFEYAISCDYTITDNADGSKTVEYFYTFDILKSNEGSTSGATLHSSISWTPGETYTMTVMAGETKQIPQASGFLYYKPWISNTGQQIYPINYTTPYATAYSPYISINGGITSTEPDSETIIINYNTNGGLPAIPSQTGTINSNITISDVIPTKVGYKFMAWTAEPGTTSNYTNIQPSSTHIFNMSCTLNAVWWEVATQIIVYDDNGGVGGPGAICQNVDNYLVVSDIIPTRTGYRFLGWTVSSTTGVLVMPGANLPITDNVTFYAKWESTEPQDIYVVNNKIYAKEFIVENDLQTIEIDNQGNIYAASFTPDTSLGIKGGILYAVAFIHGLPPTDQAVFLADVNGAHLVSSNNEYLLV